MKKVLCSLFLLLALSSVAQSYSISVTESNEAIGAGNNNALVVTLYETDIETVEKEWKSRVKDFNTEKTNLSKHSLFADNAVIKEMGNGTVDIYTNFSEKKEDRTVRMIVAFDLGGAFCSSSNDKGKFEVAKKIVQEFAIRITKESVSEKLKLASKALEKLEDKQKDLEKENKNLQDDIKNYNEKIKKAEEDTKKNVAEQETKKKEIEAQKKVVEEVKKKLDGVK